MTQIIDGQLQAKTLLTLLSKVIQDEKLSPKLGIILVGNDPASETYVRLKKKRGESIGVAVDIAQFETDASEEEVLAQINTWNQDTSVSGIIVQLPLPKHLDSSKVINAVAVEKDVDGFTFESAGRVSSNQPILQPATPLGVVHLIKSALGENLSGKHAVVVGQSLIVGRPMSLMLVNEECTVVMTHKHTANLAELCRAADILVVAAGVPHLITPDYVKPGACVIDVGFNQLLGKTIGDVDYDAVAPVAGSITPVPGGVGPMTIAMLLSNTVQACKESHGS